MLTHPDRCRLVQLIDEPTMLIKVNPKAIIGGSEFADLPAAPVHVQEQCTAQDLQEAIYAACSVSHPTPSIEVLYLIPA